MQPGKTIRVKGKQVVVPRPSFLTKPSREPAPVPAPMQDAPSTAAAASASAASAASASAAPPATSKPTKNVTPPADAQEEKPTAEEERLVWEHISENFGQNMMTMMAELMDPRNRDFTLGKCGGLTITGSDVQKIRIGEWLNDTIIDAYLGMIKKRNAADPNLPQICVLNCMFYEKYRKDGYKGVQRWCRNAFSHDIILMPMCDQNHWALVIADFEKNVFIYYDSLKFHTSERLHAFTFYYCGILREFLLDEAKAKNLGQEKIDKITKMQICASCEPLQQNDSDCGVFVLYFAECYTRRSKTLNFCQALMVQFRVRLFFEIVHNQIFDPYVVPSLTPILPPAKVPEEKMEGVEETNGMNNGAGDANEVSNANEATTS